MWRCRSEWAKAINNKVKWKSVETIRPFKQIKTELRKEDIPGVSSSIYVSLVRHNIHRARLSVHPKLLKNAKEPDKALSSMDIKNNTGENFYLVNDEQNSITE